MSNSRRQRAFISGENVDLLIPSEDDAEFSNWADWFNSQETTKHTNHGLYPNTRSNQLDFFRSLGKSNRISLLIVTKNSPVPIGTVSLSNIDFRKSSAEIAIIMDKERTITVPPLASFESIALMTQHAFEVLGLIRIDSAQVFPDIGKWNQWMELLGYRAEGFKRLAFKRGHDFKDVILNGCIFPNYLALKELRGGKIWPGNKIMMQEISKLPKKSFAEILYENFFSLKNEYFDF